MPAAVSQPSTAMRLPDEVPGLDLVKERLVTLLKPVGPMLAPAAHLSGSVGKLLRPALTLLSASLTGEVTDEVIDTAVAVELIHTASLTHDDVVDEANTRRGRPSVRYRFGNKTAVLLGDYLFTTAFELLNRSRKRTVIRSLSAAIKSMSSGELLHLSNLYRIDLTEEQYYQYVEMKTASLMSASCEAGALAAGGRTPVTRRLRSFGWNLGIAYQIIDDLMDLTGLASGEGKPSAADLRLGVVTLPVIRLVGAHGWGEKIASLWRDRRWRDERDDPPELGELLDALWRNGCLAYALDAGRSYMSSAIESLSGFGDSPIAEVLRGLVTQVESRCPQSALEQSHAPECPASGIESGAVRPRAADDFPGNTPEAPAPDLPV